MKPGNKLGRLEFDSKQAFENLRKFARGVLSAPKIAVDIRKKKSRRKTQAT